MRSLFAGTILFILSLVCFGQSAAFHAYSGSIVGPTGKPVAGADIRLEIAGHTLRTASDNSGDFVISTPLSGPAAVEIHAAGFDVLRKGIAASRPAQLKLMLATDVQRIVVTASKTPMALDQSASAVQTLSKRELQRTPALAVGDKLRQVTGLT
ncbi:MAG: carboxypeptidase regulatory-like domain-containing protein, partial [Acidobacteriaceae bacterium]